MVWASILSSVLRVLMHFPCPVNAILILEVQVHHPFLALHMPFWSWGSKVSSSMELSIPDQILEALSCLHSTEYRLNWCTQPYSVAVSIWWTGLALGLVYGTGLWDWTVGLDCGTGLWDWAHKLCPSDSKQHTHYCTTVYLHNMNSKSISLGPNEVSATISAGVHAIQICYLHWCKPNKHWPLSNGSTVNMRSCTLI